MKNQDGGEIWHIRVGFDTTSWQHAAHTRMGYDVIFSAVIKRDLIRATMPHLQQSSTKNVLKAHTHTPPTMNKQPPPPPLPAPPGPLPNKLIFLLSPLTAFIRFSVSGWISFSKDSPKL